MAQKIGDLSPEEFEAHVERVVDRRLAVWYRQLLDALSGSDDEEEADLRPEFAVSLRRALQQAQNGEGIDLQTFRAQIGH